MKGSQLAVRCERVGYNAEMVALATTQIERTKLAILPRADARAGEGKSATVSFWSDYDAHITIIGPSTHELHGFYLQETSEVASVDQSNQQYSILALTDSSGNVSERYAYTAYGQPTFLNSSATVQTSSAAGNRYTYTAREWDSTLGLHHFRARWMSGLTGRLLTRDPIGYLDSINVYGFRHTLQGCDPTGNATWIVGPEAATVSFIKAFSPTHEDFWRFHDESQIATGNRLQPGDLFLVMLLLAELARSANPDPATSYANWNTLLNSEEFRGFGRLQVEIQCCNGLVKDSNVISDVNHGYTPIRLGSTTITHEAGEGSSTLMTVGSTTSPCLRAILKHQFRIGWVGQFISRLALGVGVPFAWADFDYTLCCNKSYDITWSGSHFPTHWAYLDGVKVGGRGQRDLAGFVFRTPDARASGGTFHNASGSAREVER